MIKNFSAIVKQRVDGYALLFAVFIFAVIIILSSSLILAAYYNNIFFNRITQTDKLYLNATSGINLLLVHPDLINYKEEKILSLFGEVGDSVKLEKEQWGIFDVLTVTAFANHIKIRKSALAGDYFFDSSNTALFVADQGKPISITGDAVIKGNCQLPESGFKRAYIEGKNFTGKQMVDGKTKKSDKSLPDLSIKITQLKLDYFITNYLKGKARIIPYKELEKDSIITSFNDSVTVLYSKEKIDLANIYLRGKIIVLSERSIELSSSADVSEIVCFAPFIHVLDDFKGKVQLFGRDSIKIEEDCLLKYPSVVGIAIEQSVKKNPFISIGEKTQVNGMVYIYQKTTTIDKQPFLSIKKNALIKGQVYSNGYTEIKGNVYGSLYTNKFILSTPSAVYENMLMDADIDIFKLSRNYIGVDFIEEQKYGKVIKWLF